MGTVLKEALRMMSKLETMARKAARRNPLNGHDYEDLIQGFLLKVIEKEDLYDEDIGVKIRTWLYRVFQNYIRDLMRRQLRNPVRFYSPISSNDEIERGVDNAYTDKSISNNARKLEVRAATYDLLSWLKENDYKGWLVITLMLRHGGSRYHTSLEADMTIREINRIITRIRNCELTKELLKGAQATNG